MKKIKAKFAKLIYLIKKSLYFAWHRHHFLIPPSAMKKYIKSFIEQNGYTLPVLMDDGGMIASYYGIQAIPTNFVIKPDGTVLGYIPGRVGEETIRKLIEEVKE